MMMVCLHVWLFLLWLNVKGSLQQNDPRCEVGVLPAHIFVAGLPAQNQPITPGHKLRFLCHEEYKLNGSSEIECLETGQWNFPVPTCSDPSCEVGVLDPRLFVSGLPPQDQQIQLGHKLQFRCSEDSKLIGLREIECLQAGQWNAPFPKCSGTLGCSTPPSLENGDYLGTKSQYAHNDMVEYNCQSYHIIQGGPYKTCRDGVWTGEIKCLKPCTVSQHDLDENKIEFLRSELKKVYVPHNDHITFICHLGYLRVNNVAMRQKCNDGEIVLPICQRRWF